VCPAAKMMIEEETVHPFYLSLFLDMLYLRRVWVGVHVSWLRVYPLLRRLPCYTVVLSPSAPFLNTRSSPFKGAHFSPSRRRPSPSVSQKPSRAIIFSPAVALLHLFLPSHLHHRLVSLSLSLSLAPVCKRAGNVLLRGPVRTEWGKSLEWVCRCHGPMLFFPHCCEDRSDSSCHFKAKFSQF
jgi:hypothetical protein